MEETTQHPQTQATTKKDNAIVFYILGGLIVTAIIVAGFMLMPRGSQETAQEAPVLGQTQTAPAPTATPAVRGPIGSLTCTSQFYNTVNGVAGSYYVSTEGEVPTSGGQVTCVISASVNDQVVATETVTPALNADASRGGSTFRCTTQAMRVTPGVPAKVTTELRDTNGVTASCNRMFMFP